MRLAGAIGSVVLCLATAAVAQPLASPGGLPASPPGDPDYEGATLLPLNLSDDLVPTDPVGPVGDAGPVPVAPDLAEPVTGILEPAPEGPKTVEPPKEEPRGEPVVPDPLRPVAPEPVPEVAPEPATVPVDPLPQVEAQEPAAQAPPPQPAAAGPAPQPAGRPAPRQLGWLASWSVAEPEAPAAAAPPPAPAEPPLVLASWTVPEEPAEEQGAASAAGLAGPATPQSMAQPLPEPAPPEPVLASSDYAPWAPSPQGGGEVAASSSVLVPVAAAAAVTATLVPLVRWVLGPFLLSRIRREDLLRQATRARIHDFVVNNPGAHLSEIRRALGMSKGPTSYHLQVLVAAGIVVKVENPPYSSYFANGASEGVRAAARALRVPKARALLARILERPGIDVQDLVDGSPMARSMVYYHLNRLADVGLVEFQGGVRNRALVPTQLAQHVAGTVGAETVPVGLVEAQARPMPA
jgi:DNA-binding transcriptional ArsR family regulator